MAKVVWSNGINYVSGALNKVKKGQHDHEKMLLGTHRVAATTSTHCNRIYLRDENNFTKSNSADAMWARQRFQGIAALVDYRRKDLSRLSQDQMNFLAQRNNPRGKKTMKSYYWYICGQEWDAEHPRP